MTTSIDLRGQKFGRLVAVAVAERHNGAVWLCRCDCGNDKLVRSGHLRNGGVRSCGCEPVGRKVSAAPWIDITGERFGRLVALRPERRARDGKWGWVCRCDCGREMHSFVTRLKSGKTKSCGCINRPHGRSKTNEYGIWCGIIRRCQNTKTKSYIRYGGRGITVDPVWLGPGGFMRFLADMGPRPSKSHSVDRIDGNGPYSPDNCRWATRIEQTRNRRSTRWIVVYGERMSLKEACDNYGADLYLVWTRITSLGWSAEKALTTPKHRSANHTGTSDDLARAIHY